MNWINIFGGPVARSTNRLHDSNKGDTLTQATAVHAKHLENLVEPTHHKGGLSISEAKAALAQFYGVKENAIEIVIRG